MSSEKIEVEVKFIVPDISILSGLPKKARLGSFDVTPLGSQRVVDHYLDTADKRLYLAGFACRVRIIKDRQILTLKSLTPATGHIHRRQEIEMEVASERPQDWAEEKAKQLILDMAQGKPLQTLFSLYQTRHKFQALLKGRPVIEFSLDEVSLHRPDRVDYFELEAELTQVGSEADLKLFIDTLKSTWPLAVETRSKFERGLASLKE